jgi:hypothetical protein
MLARLVILTMVLGGTAHAVVLCAKPKQDGTFDSAVMIRQSCRSDESQLDPGVLGLQGPKGDPGQCTCPRTCKGTGTTCTTDTDCKGVTGVCDNTAGTATCVQTCTVNADCSGGMFCFPNGQLGVGVCAGCAGNDAICPGDAICHDSQGGPGDNCGVHGLAGCVGQPTLTACIIPGHCAQ